MYRIICSFSNVAMCNTNYPSQKRILVGVGGCLDIFVRAVDLLDALSITPPDSIGDPPQYLNSLDDVVTEFLTFFVEGAAAEYV